MSGVNVAGLEVRLRDGTRIVHEIGFAIQPGKVLGLVGESGSGKSTIAKALLGYAASGARITAGSVTIDGEDMLTLSETERRSRRGRLVSYVPQDAGISLNPGLPIGLQLIERLVAGKDAQSRAEAAGRVSRVLDAVRLPSDRNFLARFPSELSGGQLQRVGLAIAVAGQPKLLVLDEPTTALDTGTRNEVLKLVSGLSQEMHLCSVYVSHDLGVVASIAQDVMVLYAGRVMEYGRSAQIFRVPRHPYTRALLKAVPSTLERKQLQGIPGTAPDLRSRSVGCTFATRCALADQHCREEEPSLTSEDQSRVRCYKPDIMSPATGVVPLPVKRTRSDRVFAIENLRVRYGEREVLHSLSLDVAAGECLALVGESGSGKSTLARCVIGLHSDYDGAVRFRGETLPLAAGNRSRDMHRKIQYIFQDPYASLNPRRTVGDSIAIAVRHFFPGEGKSVADTVASALLRAGLAPEMMTRYPSELSGGERQRVAIARALVCKPELLVCDEPTSALDVSVQASIIELLRGLMVEGLAMLFVTHDLAVVRSIADRVAVLHGGGVEECASTDTLFSAPGAAYSKELLRNALNIETSAVVR
jgi:peptide/nickel transport system ATP-binding protein